MGSEEVREVATVSSGGTPNRSNSSYWNGNIPWISTTLIDFNFIEKSEDYITKEGLKNSSAKLFPKGTLLMAMYGQGKTRGKIAILNIEATTNQACGAIITNNKILNSLFAFQNLTKRYDEIRNLSNQGGQENLSGGIIKGIEINFPNLEEQSKIANFLSLFDERITTQKKIIKNLESLMQGFGEKIFSQKLRFKDEGGNEFHEWEESNLENICQKQSSNISANKIEDNFGNYNIYGASGILKKVDFYEEENDYISILKDGAGVGRLFLCEGKSSVLGTMDIIKPKSDVNTYFLFYQLSNIDFTKYITGSTIPHIYFKDYKKENLEVPSVEEQNKIAGFLFSIDEKIIIEKKVLAQYESQKKYVLSNLFI